MNLKCLIIIISFMCIGIEARLQYFTKEKKYEPTWESLDSRPLPHWYDNAKIGIFIHWGVFSVPSFGGEWFWNSWKNVKKPEYVNFMKKNYEPNFTYQDFAKEFTAEFYDPQKWAELFQSAGARYVVLTSKHHEGYTLWPSKFSFSWNSQDVGPNRNLLKDFANAVRNYTDLRFGVYHSLYEWFNPLYLEDKANNFTTNAFVRMKTMPELYELVNLFLPEIVWSDGEWEAPDTYWNSKEFLAWLYNDSPVKDTVVSNDRWGMGTLCKHGDFYTCQDRYNPGTLQPHKWENCLTIDSKSWGYRRNAPLADYLTINQLIKELVITVSCGGNFLINVGPTKEGIITPIYEERLLQMGLWLGINGEAIYYSRPWAVQKDEKNKNVWYTQRSEFIYAMVLEWPTEGFISLGSIRLGPNGRISLLGFDGEDLKFKDMGTYLDIIFPEPSKVRSQWAYVIKFFDAFH